MKTSVSFIIQSPVVSQLSFSTQRITPCPLCFLFESPNSFDWETKKIFTTDFKERDWESHRSVKFKIHQKTQSLRLKNPSAALIRRIESVASNCAGFVKINQTIRIICQNVAARNDLRSTTHGVIIYCNYVIMPPQSSWYNRRPPLHHHLD